MTRERTDVRAAAESIYTTVNMYRQYPNIDHMVGMRSQSINLITEDFLAGYMQDGRMSVVRRFFCLFVTFDLFFISLLWLICIMVTGVNIYDALKIQVVHYTIYTSLFDIVVAAICRFLVLIFFYAILYINHWIVIALSTSGSCAFLISKVFVYDWIDTPQPVFQVVLILTSFILAWGEAWFLDCRVIPQERHARSYFPAFTPQTEDRTPLVAPFLTTESVANFYSPYDSVHHSEDEDDADQDEEYKNMGNECVRRACTLLESSDWKVEKITPESDTIRSTRKDKLGKILRLTGRIRYPARLLLEELFYNIEQVPKWNTSLLESKILKKIDSHTDISYQAAKGGGQGMVSCRDFVNLRCWQLCRNGKIIDPSEALFIKTMPLFSSSDSDSVSDDADPNHPPTTIQRASSEVKLPDSVEEEHQRNAPAAFKSLSKSLGARDFHSDDEVFEDACDKVKSSPVIGEGAVYVNAAVSIEFPTAPSSSKYIRGENLVSCWAMREIAGKPDSCIFEWLLCVDLKGYIPRYVLDAAFLTQMQTYMTQLRAHCAELRKEQVPTDV